MSRKPNFFIIGAPKCGTIPQDAKLSNPQDTANWIRIIIGAASRSGSTLLDLLLGQADGFVSLGEVCNIWVRSFIENQLCGCGKPFKECEFWQAVVKEAFGEFKKINAQHILKIQRSVARIRYTPLLIYPSLCPKKFQSLLEEYKQILESLYSAISRVSSYKVLIDSSKAPPHAFVLTEISSVDLYIVHLVRDSRAVAYSWQRKKEGQKYIRKRNICLC